MLKILLKIFNIKKIFFLIFLVIKFQNISWADDIQKFQIEGMSIGDSALDYFSESQLEDNEQGWHNYSYKEYSTSLMPGKGIYDWFLVSYNNNDENFAIVALVSGLSKNNYKKKECNNKLDDVSLNMTKLFENTKQENKKKYKLTVDASRTYPFTGKSHVTSKSFNFPDGAEIILACYNMDKEANKKSNFMMSILNQKDSFRINVRSHVFVNYLKKGE